VRDPEQRIMWGIILLAAFLRLGYLDLIEFREEQVRYLTGGLEIVRDLRLPLAGLRLRGVVEPPLMSYLLAIPLLIGRDPRISAAFIGLLNVGAVASSYLLARRYLGLRVAIISAALFAANPWAVTCARRISAVGVLVPLSVVELWALYRGVADRSRAAWAVATAVMGLMVGITLTAAPLLLALITLLVVYRRRVSWYHALFGICLAFIILLPYLYYQNIHRFSDMRAAVSSLRQEAGAAPVWLALQYASWVHSGRHLASLVGGAADRFLPSVSWLGRLEWLPLLTFLLSVPWVGVMVLTAWSHWRDGRDLARFAVLALWLWLPLGLLSLQAGGIEPRSLAVLYPAGFLAMGLAVDSLLGWIRARATCSRWWLPYLQVPIWLILGLLVAWQAYSVVYLYGFVSRHDVQGQYGVPYRFWRYTAGLVRRAVRGVATDQVWVISQGADPERDEEPALLDYLLAPRVRTVFLGQGGTDCLLLPAGRPGVYLLTRPAPRAEQMLRQLRAEEKGVVLLPERDYDISVRVVETREVEEMLSLVDRRGLWGLDSGLRLVGYGVPAGARLGQLLPMTLSWTFQDIPAQEHSASHSLVSYVAGPTGTPLAQRQSFGLPERYWAEGLLLLQWVDLMLPRNLPDGEYALLLGMDRLNNPYRHRLIDEKGQVIGDAIPLGTVRVSK
jgi:4-amino-4-deoxy-L-arabinose transferase-like glycosyltransferase